MSLYTHTTRAVGLILTAAIYNADHVNHADSQTALLTEGYSPDVATMRTVTSPGAVGSESLAASVAAELARIRYMLRDLSGGAQWYSQGPYVNVCSPRYGATGDGTTDDTAAVNNARADAISSGLPLLFPGGKTFAIDQFEGASNLAVIAHGATILHNGDNKALLYIHNSAAPTTAIIGMRWYGGKIKAKQSATDPTTALVYVDAAQHNFFNFEWLQGNDGNIATGGTRYATAGIVLDSSAGANRGVYYNLFLGFPIIGCTQDGIVINSVDGAATNRANANTFDHVPLHFNSQYGFNCTNGGQNNKLMGGSIEANTVAGVCIGPYAQIDVNVHNENNAGDGVVSSGAADASVVGHSLFWSNVLSYTPDAQTLQYFSEYVAGNVRWSYASKRTNALQVFYRDSVAQQLASYRLLADANDRLAITTRVAGGELQFGNGTDAADANLYRSAANLLATDDQLYAADGIRTKTKAGVPGDGDFTVDADGVLAVDTTNHHLYFRSGGTWRRLVPA